VVGDLIVLDATTNLPDGTVVDLYFYSSDLESPSREEVTSGIIPIRSANNTCHQTEAGLVGSDVRVTITVHPFLAWQGVGGPFGFTPPSPSPQPAAVQAALGPHFENVTGAQVKHQGDETYLQTSRFYELPADTCTRKLYYTGDGSFQRVPVGRAVSLPDGPFPQAPFAWCPDVAGLMPVEGGNARAAEATAVAFDRALATHDDPTLSELADPSVATFDQGWTPTRSDPPDVFTSIPNGFYISAVPRGCGASVALRTLGVAIGMPSAHAPTITYLMVLRRSGWRVWGEVPYGP